MQKMHKVQLYFLTIEYKSLPNDGKMIIVILVYLQLECSMFSAADLICFFDATVDEELAVVSGYVSTPAKWQSFEIDWRLLLAKENLPYFHMREFTVSRGPFLEWKNSESRRRRVISDLAAIIKIHAIRGFATLVPVKNYLAVDQRFQLTERAGNPYSFCARCCAEKVRNWARSARGSKEAITYIFEDGDEEKADWSIRLGAADFRTRYLSENFSLWPTDKRF